MAVNDHNRDDRRDDNVERDPQLARLLEAAGREAPPAALDAAILAAARREVASRPQAAGGGGAVAVPVRAKRNWYVPVSLAAVLVLSVSLVSVMQHEKGDELMQPRSPVGAEALKKLPQSAPASKPAAEADAAAAQLEQPAVPAVGEAAREARQRSAENTPAEYAAPTQPAAKVPPQAQSQLQADAPKSLAERADVRSKTAPAELSRREVQAPAAPAVGAADSSTAAAPTVPAAPAPGAAAVPAVPGTPSAEGRVRATPPAAMADRRPEAFPQVPPERESRESRDARDAPPRDAVTVRPQAAPAPAAPAAAPEERSVAAAPPPPPTVAAKPMAAPAAKRAQAAARPAWLTELDNQPPERWLARLAEFKRDGRNADADILMVEFRRRFPDHPASER